MSMIVDKAKINGIFGGVKTPSKGKSAGKAYLSVISEGPKVDKFVISSPEHLHGTAVFGDRVTVELLDVEQKFNDFNGSFSEVKAAKITVTK